MLWFNIQALKSDQSAISHSLAATYCKPQMFNGPVSSSVKLVYFRSILGRDTIKLTVDVFVEPLVHHQLSLYGCFLLISSSLFFIVTTTTTTHHHIFSFLLVCLICMLGFEVLCPNWANCKGQYWHRWNHFLKPRGVRKWVNWALAQALPPPHYLGQSLHLFGLCPPLWQDRKI